MISFLIAIGLLGLAVQAFIGASFFVSCIWEKETRAAVFAFLQFIGMTMGLGLFLALSLTGFFNSSFGTSVLIMGVMGALAAVLLLLKRNKPNQRALEGTSGFIVGEVKRVDEREIVFARNRSLRPGSEQFDSFYQEHPHYREYDDKRRAMGGPMGQIGTIDTPDADINNAMTFASINIPAFLGDPEKVTPDRHPALKKKMNDKKIVIPPQEATRRVKGYTKRLGVCLVGIAPLNPLWIYSKRGEIFRENWEEWGKEISVDHTHVIVFAEEMELALVGTAPHTPTNIESMYNYAKGAFISTQLASFIANLGYSATANHLRHYDGLMVPLAVDAGLGEVSRMGYLMTKEFGPRVRLSAVTTDLPLVPDRPVDIGVEAFCRICKKCAVNCPSLSIPHGDKETVNGTLRWKLNVHTCFDYWGKIGTDCNRCMATCPWGHANTFPHRLIRFLITRNTLAGSIFSWMDDLFYGRQPKPKPGPDWTSYR